MSNMHRLSWIDAQIRQGRYPNCTTIARRFEISPRQAARDIEYLRDSMNAPIEYSPERRGYYYTTETFTLTNLLLTQEQKHGLAYLSAHYSQMESEHAAHLARLFHRLLENAPDDDPGPSTLTIPPELETVETSWVVQKAIQDQVKIAARVDGEDCTISPYKLYAHEDGPYIIGHVEPGNKIRFFALKRLEQVVGTSHPADLRPLLRQADIVPELADEPEVAIIRFSVPVYAQRLGLRTTALPGGLHRVEYHHVDNLIGPLAVCPCDFYIHSPAWLRNLVSNRLSKILRNHGTYDRICLTPSLKLQTE